MDEDQRDREDQGETDIPEFTGVIDPLAELAADLVICEIALEEGRGAFCDDCDCTFGFHCSMDNGILGICELCGCIGVYHSPKKPLTRIPDRRSRPDTISFSPWSIGYNVYGTAREREKAAREALRELTE